jgi:hypothetical protein
MVVKILGKFSQHLAFVGFLLGSWGGFIVRDEFYLSSFEKIDVLS